MGAGIFGVTAAIELRKRGLSVDLLDPGPLPHPLAESTDISKIVRLDYGPDDDYLALMEDAIEGWRRWNASFSEPLFHETGVAFLTRAPMAPGGFEHESFLRLRRRGHPVERVDAASIRRRFPAWSTGAYVDGYWSPVGGFAQSGRVVEQLAREAEQLGVTLHQGQRFDHLIERGSRVAGVRTREGVSIEAEIVVAAMGAWIGHALPFLAASFHSVGQPVFHLRPADPTLFEAARFPVFGADIARTGYYGFPVTRDGRVKIANHGLGRAMHPEARERVTTEAEEAALRAFLQGTFPALADAPVIASRVCVYGDSLDGHFWIARDPDREGLVIAAGGSGHGFKFAPVLGDLVANAALGVADARLAKFRWRPEVRPPHGEEAARYRGDEAHAG